MKTHILATSLFLFLATGCSFIRPREVTQEDKERLVFSAARAAVVVAVTEIHKDDVNEQVGLAAAIVATIDNKFMPLLTNPDVPVTKEIEQQILQWIPDNYKALMVTAFEVLNTYYEFPTGAEVLPNDMVALLRAFASGVRTGAGDILLKNKAELHIQPGVSVTE